MPLRYDLPFHPLIGATAPSFNITLTTVSSANVFESTAVGRSWSGPSGRAIRLAESSGVDYRIAFGTSTIVAAATDSMLVLGAAAEAFQVQPGQTYIAIMTSSTQVSDVNVTLGYGR